MPTIIENTQQVNALNEIEAALAIIKSINTIISAGDGALAIVYKPEKGRKVQVDVPDASRAKAIGILSTTKDRLVKDVKSKAAKFHIGRRASRQMRGSRRTARVTQQKARPRMYILPKRASRPNLRETLATMSP